MRRIGEAVLVLCGKCGKIRTLGVEGIPGGERRKGCGLKDVEIFTG